MASEEDLLVASGKYDYDGELFATRVLAVLTADDSKFALRTERFMRLLMDLLQKRKALNTYDLDELLVTTLRE